MIDPAELAPYMYEHADGSVSVGRPEQIREIRETEEAAYFHDQHPGRWGDHVSPARMRRDLEREREEEVGP